MNTADAAYETVRSYPGGAAALGARMGVNSMVLSHKVNPNNASNRLALDEAVRLMALTGDVRILQSMAAELGYVLSKMPVFDGVSDMAVLEIITLIWARNGEMGAHVNQAFADGRITRREFEQIKADVFNSASAGMELINRLEQLVEGHG